jgi:hypothetical protein
VEPVAMITEFSTLIPKGLLQRSGSVFLSGKAAFGAPSKLYILGLNPGGCPDKQSCQTVEWHTKKVLSNELLEWSEYEHEKWNDQDAGTCGMQPRVLHMLDQLKLKAGHVPSSNLIFVRTTREKHLKAEFENLATQCWPFHQAVIDRLKIRVVLCFGQTAGKWVRKQLKTSDDVVDEFVEVNNRRWRSSVFKNAAGVAVVVATHPSIASWNTPAADPTHLIARLLANEQDTCGVQTDSFPLSRNVITGVPTGGNVPR